MKSLLLGMIGAAMLLGAFALGRVLEGKADRLKVVRENSRRFEMQVTAGAEIVRLDRVTGMIRIITPNRIITDFPEPAGLGMPASATAYRPETLANH